MTAAGVLIQEYQGGIVEYRTIGGTTTSTTSGMVILGTTSTFRQEPTVNSSMQASLSPRCSTVTNLM
jgi:hypothetical protein